MQCQPAVPPPVPPFLLTQNISPQDIAGSDIRKLKVSWHLWALQALKGFNLTTDTVARAARLKSETKILCWGQFETTALPCDGSWEHRVPEMLRLSAEDRHWDLLAKWPYKIRAPPFLSQLRNDRIIAVSNLFPCLATITLSPLSSVSPSALAQF